MGVDCYQKNCIGDDDSNDDVIVAVIKQIFRTVFVAFISYAIEKCIGKNGKGTKRVKE